MSRRFLLYTCAGKNSQIQRWANNKNRLFDIFVTNYSDSSGLNREYADFYNERKGAKFPNFKYLYDNKLIDLNSYEGVMITDDDIIISSNSLDSLFLLLIKENLWILQPSYSSFGKISHEHTKRALTSSMRYTNFVEVGYPIFKTEKLEEFMSVYDAKLTCYGLDWWFSSFLNKNETNKLAISDRYWCVNPHDEFKLTNSAQSVREIDLLYSHEDRIKVWGEFQKKYKIKKYTKKIFMIKPENIFLLTIRIPRYIFDEVFNYLFYSKIIRGTIKRFISIIKK